MSGLCAMPPNCTGGAFPRWWPSVLTEATNPFVGPLIIHRSSVRGCEPSVAVPRSSRVSPPRTVLVRHARTGNGPRGTCRLAVEFGGRPVAGPIARPYTQTVTRTSQASDTATATTAPAKLATPAGRPAVDSKARAPQGADAASAGDRSRAPETCASDPPPGGSRVLRCRSPVRPPCQTPSCSRFPPTNWTANGILKSTSRPFTGNTSCAARFDSGRRTAKTANPS